MTIEAALALCAALLDTAAAHVYVVDDAGRLTHATGPLDPFAGQSPGPDAADMHGRPLEEAAPPGQWDSWRGAVRSLTRADAELFETTVSIRMGDGAQQMSRVVGRPLRSTDGRVVGAVFVSIELDPTVLVERDPSGNVRRTEEARLDVARQLAATLNHEINNPLFIVSATLEDLLAEATDEGATRRLQGALDAVWRVAAAVKQLQEIRQIVSTTYIPGYPMIDLEASSHRPGRPQQ